MKQPAPTNIAELRGLAGSPINAGETAEGLRRAIPIVGGTILGLVRRIDRLFDNVAKAQTAVEALEKRLRDVEDRMTRMEAGQDLQIEKARGAAAAAAAFAINTHLVDIASRLGAVEQAMGQFGRKRLEQAPGGSGPRSA